jgi:flagellar hook-length control protein FliK
LYRIMNAVGIPAVTTTAQPSATPNPNGGGVLGATGFAASLLAALGLETAGLAKAAEVLGAKTANGEAAAEGETASDEPATADAEETAAGAQEQTGEGETALAGAAGADHRADPVAQSGGKAFGVQPDWTPPGLQSPAAPDGEILAEATDVSEGQLPAAVTEGSVAGEILGQDIALQADATAEADAAPPVQAAVIEPGKSFDGKVETAASGAGEPSEIAPDARTAVQPNALGAADEVLLEVFAATPNVRGALTSPPQTAPQAEISSTPSQAQSQAPAAAPPPRTAEALAQSAVAQTSAPVQRPADLVREKAGTWTRGAEQTTALRGGPLTQGGTAWAAQVVEITAHAAAKAATGEAARPFNVAAAEPTIGEAPPPPDLDGADPALDAQLAAATGRHAPAGGLPKATPDTVSALSAHLVQNLNGARATRFEIQLDPAGLGRVDVRVEISRSGELTAALTFDNPHAAHELRARAGELQAALQGAGFDLARTALQFNNGGQFGAGAFAQGENGQGQGAAHRDAAFANLDDNSESLPQPAQSRARPGGVDVRI